MKTPGKYILILSSVFLLAAKPSGEDCYESYKNVQRLYKKYLSDQCYFRYNTYTVIDGIKSEELKTEVWRNGLYYKYENPYVTVFQDPDNQAIIMHDQKTVIIRKTVLGDNDVFTTSMIDSLTLSRDSLQKVTIGMLCSNSKSNSSFSLTYKKDIQQKYGIASITTWYDAELGLIKKQEFSGANDDIEEKQVIVYEEYKNGVVYKAYPSINRVLVNGHLKTEYNGYELVDLRITN